MLSFNLPSSAVKKHKKSFSWLDTGPNKKWSHKVVELVAFALIVPVIGHLFFRNDPVGMNSGFAWVILPPVIFAARYGSVWGFVCAIASVSVLAYPWQAYADQTSALITLGVGTIILSILVGDFASAGKKQSAQESAENKYLRHRIKEFSKDYHVLKVSHGQLEEFMAGNRLSVRQALQQLKPMLKSNNSDEIKAGSELMAVFAQYGAVQVAGLYGVKEKGRVDPKPIATHGDMPELNLFDPLIKLSIEHKKLVSVQLQAQETETVESELLAVVPIVDSHDHLHGVLVIKDMHFMAFQQENLNVLSLLGSYVGDLLTRSKGEGESQSGWFMAELSNAIRFAHSSKVPSCLLALRLTSNAQTQFVIDFLTTNTRSLDSNWQPDHAEDQATIVFLLPLMTEVQGQAFLQRVSKKLFDEQQIDLSSMTEIVSTKLIKTRDTEESCLNFVNKVAGYGKDKGKKNKNSRWKLLEKRNRAA